MTSRHVRLRWCGRWYHCLASKVGTVFGFSPPCAKVSVDVRVIRDFQMLDTVLKSRLQARMVKLVTFRLILTRPLDRRVAKH